MAPLPVSSKGEYQLYNSLLKSIFAQGRNPDVRDWNAIAREFLAQSMGGSGCKGKIIYPNVYPKTVDQLRRYFTTWKHNQRIRLLGKQLNLSEHTLVKTMRGQRVQAPNIQKTQLPLRAPQFLRKPLEQMQNYVPPDSVPNQNCHVKLEMKGRGMKQQDHTYQRLLTMEKGSLRKQTFRCAYFPFCMFRVWDCSGYSYAQCKIITDLPEKDQEEFKQKIKQANVKARVKVANKQRRRRQIQLQEAATDESKKREEFPEIIEILDDTDEPFSVPSPYHRKRNHGMIVSDSAMKALGTTGMLVDDQVVDAYLSLLVNECNSQKKKQHMAVVQCGVLPWLPGITPRIQGCATLIHRQKCAPCSCFLWRPQMRALGSNHCWSGMC